MIDPIAAGLVAVYCIAMLAIGVWASKKIQNIVSLPYDLEHIEASG